MTLPTSFSPWHIYHSQSKQEIRAISPVWERLPPRFTSPSRFSWWSSDSFVFGAGQTVARVMLIKPRAKALVSHRLNTLRELSLAQQSRAVASVLSICWRITRSLMCCWSVQALVHHHLLLADAIHFSVIWDWLSPLRMPSIFLSKLQSMRVELYLVHYDGWCFWRDFSNWMWLARLLTVRKDGSCNDSLTQTGFGWWGALCGAFKVQQLVQLIHDPISTRSSMELKLNVGRDSLIVWNKNNFPTLILADVNILFRCGFSCRAEHSLNILDLGLLFIHNSRGSVRVGWMDEARTH